jgi:trimeric autotransporter adhesin
MARHAPVIWRELLLATTCLVAAGPAAYAGSTVLPTGPVVVAGSGTVSTSNSTMTIVQNTGKAIFNWSSFSISSGAIVAFQQPGSGSIALNRVTGAGPSQIDGKLTANGHVWIVNRSGVFFGAGSQVNVAGLMATTANIRNEDFLAGNYKFFGATDAAIVNQGEIRAASGGYVVLAGEQVRNEGLIQADLGTIQLAAGKSFALDLTGDKLIRFQVTEAIDMTPVGADGKPIDSLISNTGKLIAGGGRVVMTARAARNVVDNVINTTGIVEATSVAMVNGEIVLDGGENGAVQVADRLDAGGKQVGQTGGTVSVLGDKVALASGATIDVSGNAGGGTALIGGAAHGAGPQQNASVTLVAGGASITADALSSGNGGTVVLWSDRSTTLAGSLSARGGALGGNGGFVETSSKGHLGITAAAQIDVRGPAGRAGSWLLDPSNVTIGDGSGGTVAASTISQSLNSGTNVAISTGESGHQRGDITVNSAIVKTAGSNAALTLNAANDITFNAEIKSIYNKLDVNLVAGGAVTLNASITTNGGNLTSSSQQFVNQAAINAGIGRVNLFTHFDTTIGADITAGQFTSNIDHPGQNFSLLAGATITTTGGVTVSDLGGTLTIGGSINASGVNLQAASFEQTGSGTINAGTGNLWLAADRVALGGAAGSIRGTGQAYLVPISDHTSIGLGTAGGEFQLSQTELNTLTGFSGLTIGKHADRSNAGSQNIHLGGPLSFALATTIVAGRGGAITLDSDAHVTANLANWLNFRTGVDGSFTQGSGATIDAGAGMLAIAADHIALGGGAGSISGSGAVSLAPVSEAASIGLGTAEGDFTLTQGELNTLTGFSNLTIGTPDRGSHGHGHHHGEGGDGGYHRDQDINLAGDITFMLPTTIAAVRNGDITLDSSARITVGGSSSLSFEGGRDGSFTQRNGATLTAANSEVSIAADSISLQGPAGSLSGGHMELRGGRDSTSIGVGTGDGTLQITQATLDRLANFTTLGIGTGDIATGLVTIDGAVTLRTTTGFGGKGDGASVVLGSQAAITTTAPDGSGIGFFSGTGGSFTQNAGATLNAGQSWVAIEADHIALNGVAGSLSGARGIVLASGADGAHSIGVGTGAGTLSLTQATLDKLGSFSHLTIGAQLPVIPGVDPLPGTSLITVGGALSLPIATTFAATAVDGSILLNGGTSLSSAGKAIDFTGGVVLAGGASPTTPTMVTVDTTKGGVAPGGAAITFQGTVDGTFGREQSLTLIAGTSGDIGFNGRVGINRGNGGGQTGVRLGDVAIRSARNVNLAMQYGTGGDGFAANSFTVGRMVGEDVVAGAASLTAASYINVNGASGNAPFSPNGGAIKINTSGDITIARNLSADGGSTNAHSAGNGGTVTLVSGGTVAIGTSGTPTQTTSSISANGYDATSSGTPGNGGTVSITAADINLPLGVFARGGDALIAGPSGGRGGSITLNATGNVAIGSASSGTVAAASTRGGASITGHGGDGGDITITSRTMALTSIVARGGDTAAASGGGNAGNVLLTAMATSGDAVTLYGAADANSSTTLSARGGRAGVTFTDGGATGGTFDGAGGNITIQGGPGGAALNGTSNVRLATNTGTALGGGSVISLNASGGSSAGAITIAGPVVGTTDKVESLRLAGGSVSIRGTIGAADKRLATLTLGGGGDATFGPIGGLASLDLSGKTAGSVTFSGAVDIDSVTTAANPYSIAFNGGGTIGDPIFTNTGTLTFNGGMTVSGGLLASGPSSTILNGILASDDNPIAIQHLVIGGDSAIVTGTAAVILGAVDQGAHSLVIAGGGNGLNADLFFGPWTGTGVRLIEPATVGASVGLAGAAGDFTLDVNSLHILASGGPSMVKIGRDDLSGAMVANAFTFDAPLRLQGRSIALNGPLTKNAGDLTLLATGDISGSMALAKTVSVAIASNRNVALQNANALQLGNISVLGTLSLTADGSITQLDGTKVLAAGTTLAAGSGNDIVLTNTENNFDAGGGAASLVVTSGRNVQVADVNLQLGNVTATGALSVTATGDITQAAGTAVVAAGTTLAGRDITLNNAGNDFDHGGGAASLRVISGRNVKLTDVNAIQLHNVSVSGALSLSVGGAITQLAGTAIVAAGTTLAAGSGNDITLASAGNNFDAGGGTATLVVSSGRNVQIADGNSLQLGNITATGALSVTASGDITQAARTAVLAAGTTLAAGTGRDITLNNAGNDFDVGGGAATLTVTSGRTLSLTDANALQLGYILPSGAFSLTAGGAITQAAGTGVIAAGTTLSAGGDIILTNAGNDFDVGGGAASLAITRGVNATLTDADALTGTINLSGELAVSATSVAFVDSVAGGQSGAAAANHATTYAPLGDGPYTINGVTFPVPTASPPAAPVVIPPTVQPTPPSPPPPQIADIVPPPPPPPAPEVAPISFTDAGAALANIAPAAGPSSGETDTGSSTSTDGDKLTDALSKPLSNTPAPQPVGKKPSTTSVVINGMLSKFQPPTSSTPPGGTTPSSQNFSSWGNEAFW